MMRSRRPQLQSSTAANKEIFTEGRKFLYLLAVWCILPENCINVTDNVNWRKNWFSEALKAPFKETVN